LSIGIVVADADSSAPNTATNRGGVMKERAMYTGMWFCIFTTMLLMMPCVSKLSDWRERLFFLIGVIALRFMFQALAKIEDRIK
jgi:hypothetical protein